MAEAGRPGRGGEGEDARAARVLAERARALATPPPAPAPESVPGLSFAAGADRYVVTLEGVLRVERIGRVARVPGTGRGVLGAVSVDGRPCALLDVPAWLSGAVPAPPRRWAIVLGHRAPEVALSADAVDLVRLPVACLRLDGGPRAGTTEDAAVILDGGAVLAGPDGARREAP